MVKFTRPTRRRLLIIVITIWPIASVCCVLGMSANVFASRSTVSTPRDSLELTIRPGSISDVNATSGGGPASRMSAICSAENGGGRSTTIGWSRLLVVRK